MLFTKSKEQKTVLRLILFKNIFKTSLDLISKNYRKAVKNIHYLSLNVNEIKELFLHPIKLIAFFLKKLKLIDSKFSLKISSDFLIFFSNKDSYEF